MPKHLPALAGRAAIIASTSAAAALLAVLPAAPAQAAPRVAPAPLVTSGPAITAATAAPALSTFISPAVPVTIPVAPVALATAPAVTAPAPAIAAAPSAVTASAMKVAMSKIGAPYVYGGAGPSTFDCSGLMQWAFKQVGVTLPRVAAAQAGVGTRVSKADLRPGDLVFFYAPISHVAMYIGDGKVVHASTSGQPVKISLLANMPFATARRI
ncbi:C40 family peptidase [Pseudonocardia sp. GCM10023141]|uniref:C40 family peptidase n=1 Tax=Pseudonocardia sp. GCM10023141 TaxID=3252653 RepID=UPI003616B1CF